MNELGQHEASELPALQQEPLEQEQNWAFEPPSVVAVPHLPHPLGLPHCQNLQQTRHQCQLSAHLLLAHLQHLLPLPSQSL